MDALNCQFYEARVAKVNCYHYRRQRFAVYQRRSPITKSPRGNKVIIEHEKKKVRLVSYFLNHTPKLVQSEEVRIRCRKRAKVIFIHNNGEARFIWSKVYIFISKIESTKIILFLIRIVKAIH